MQVTYQNFYYRFLVRSSKGAWRAKRFAQETRANFQHQYYEFRHTGKRKKGKKKGRDEGQPSGQVFMSQL